MQTDAQTADERPTKSRQACDQQEDRLKSVPCQNSNCVREATTVWTNNYGIERRFCAECDVEVNLRVLQMTEPDAVLVALDEYRTVLERRLGRGLHGLEPGRLYRGTPGNMR